MSNASLRDHKTASEGHKPKRSNSGTQIARILFLFACLGFYLGMALWLVLEVRAFPSSNETAFAASHLRLERDCGPTRFNVSWKRFNDAMGGLQ